MGFYLILTLTMLIGVGNTKQTAKKEAATNMIMIIKNISHEEMNNIPSNIHKYGFDKELPINSMRDKIINNMDKEKLCTNNSINFMEMFFKMSLNDNCCKVH